VQRTIKEVGMSAIRDEEYAAVVERERPLIQATAYLLTGDPIEAERVVQLVFAQLYGRWPGQSHPNREALRAVVRAARAPVNLPWEYRERVKLIDGPPPTPAAEQIVADLRTLIYDQRVTIVLDRYAGLSVAEIAEILHRPVDGVLLLSQQARASLVAEHPGRTSDERLTHELRDAIPYDMREAHGSADDLAHGRRLTRRRWIQRGSATLTAVVLLVVAAVLLVPTGPPVPHAAPSLPISTPTGRDCNPASATCRSKILFAWRSQMAEVATSHLDPKGQYFSGFGYAYDNRYDMPSFWTGQGGALAFEMFRLDKGATEVYLQIATSRKFAVRCGRTTHHRCVQVQFMDGNSYLLTNSTLADGGIEVQYSGKGDEVITVVAHNTQRGKMLEIDNGDLIKLVQDPRLRLPRR
jgi:DNA-directed RNA polymerase specialized sigma24 family protein